MTWIWHVFWNLSLGPEHSWKGNGLSGLLKDLGSMPPRGRLFGLFVTKETMPGIKKSFFSTWHLLLSDPTFPRCLIWTLDSAPAVVCSFPPQITWLLVPLSPWSFFHPVSGFLFQITWLPVAMTSLPVPATSLPVTWLPVSPWAHHPFFLPVSGFPPPVAMTTSRDQSEASIGGVYANYLGKLCYLGPLYYLRQRSFKMEDKEAARCQKT